MTNSKKLLFGVAVLGLALFSSCSDDAVTPDPVITSSSCVIKTMVDSDGTTTTFTFDGAKLTKVSEKDAEGTDDYIYSYTGEELTEIKLDDETYKITYTGGKVSRVDVFDGADLYTYYNISLNGDGLPSTIDVYYPDGMGNDQYTESLSYTYGNGNCTAMIVSIDTDDDGKLDYTYSYKFSSFDDKTNPHYKLINFLVDYENPLIFCKNNMLSGTIEAGGDKTALTATYKYNSNNLPSEMVVSFDGSPTTINYTYDCK